MSALDEEVFARRHMPFDLGQPVMISLTQHFQDKSNRTFHFQHFRRSAWAIAPGGGARNFQHVRRST